jgi:HlyD family secretion protein
MRASWLLVLLPLTGCTPPAQDAVMSGYAEAEFVYLAPSAAGTLQKLAVRRGDKVEKGQLLYTLDTAAEAIGSAGAQARSDQAQAQASNLQTGKRPLELRVLDEQLLQAQAALAGSSATLQRNQRLVAQGFVAALQLETLVAARDRDAARVKELQAQRAFATQAARQDEVAAAKAATRGAQADLELARWREGQRQRSAPAAASVYDVMFRVGEWVPAGSPVLSLLPPGAVKLRFFAPEPLLAKLAVGSMVAVSCDGCAAGLTARVRFVSPQAEFTPPVIYSNSSRSKLVFMVEAEPLELAGATTLKPGQPVDVRLSGVH